MPAVVTLLVRGAAPSPTGDIEGDGTGPAIAVSAQFCPDQGVQHGLTAVCRGVQEQPVQTPTELIIIDELIIII